MALTAVSAYAPAGTLFGVAVVALVFGLINLPSVSAWTVLGHGMRAVLTDSRPLRAFNVTTAVLLLSSLYPILPH